MDSYFSQNQFNQLPQIKNRKSTDPPKIDERLKQAKDNFQGFYDSNNGLNGAKEK